MIHGFFQVTSGGNDGCVIISMMTTENCWPRFLFCDD